MGLAVVVQAIATVLAFTNWGTSVIRLPVGLALFALCPGYIALAHRIQGRLLLIAAAAGLSLAVTVAAALALDLTDRGVTTPRLAVALAIVSAAGLAAHVARPTGGIRRRHELLMFSALGSLVLVVLVIALVAFRESARGQRRADSRQTFTELAGRIAEVDGQPTAAVSIVSHERTTFRFVLSANVDRRTRLRFSRVLRPNQAWQLRFPVPPAARSIQLTLGRGDIVRYRWLKLRR
ncbi:MAG TPA: hypothetical protein VGU02_11100 [Gaiellaceae bacterium]|nr:hypothetical protein [Gaiellaceae bacterium]